MKHFVSSDKHFTSLPELTPEMNMRACDLVINSIAKYPNDWDGTDIVAHSLMLDFEGGGSPAYTGIGIREMAQIKPEGVAVAAHINAIHERFGVAFRLTPERAERDVQFGAIASLNRIRIAAGSLAWKVGISMPQSLTYPNMISRPRFGFFGREVVNKKAAADLHSLLANNLELRISITQVLEERALAVKALTRQRHADILGRYAEHGSRHNRG